MSAVKLDELLRAAFDAGCNQGVGDERGLADPDDVEFAQWLAETPDVASTRDVLELAHLAGALFREQYGDAPRPSMVSVAESKWRALLEPLAEKTRKS